jgi:NitT/TauT family transport system ATP-binding protein
VPATLTLRGVEKRFGGTSVLDGLDLCVERGSVVSLVGPSGAGKTTLLRIIAGLERASAGTIAFGAHAGERPRTGMVLQDLALFPWRTAVENVEFGLELAGVPRRARREAALGLLRAFGLAGCEQRRPSQLSGGMRQRVALARALLTGPDLLLLDEPFSAVDDRTREGLQAFLLDVGRRRCGTVVLVTHRIDEAVFLSDEIVVLSPSPARVVGTVSVDLPRALRRATVQAMEVERRVRELLAFRSGPEGPAERPGRREDAAVHALARST